MKLKFPGSGQILPTMAAFIGIILIISLEYLGMFEGINTYLYDTAFRLRGMKEPSGRIIIAAIDEKSLEKFGRWPIRRKIYADLLDRTEHASVVGFDLIFSDPSDDDEEFLGALIRHPNAVLAVYLRGIQDPADSFPQITFSRKGHVHVEESIDNVVRAVFHRMHSGAVELSSLTSRMHELMNKSGLSGKKISEPAQVDRESSGILQTDGAKINYYGPPGTFMHISLADIIDAKYPPDFFHNRAVLVGITSAGIVDALATPFSQHRNKMAGVEVHANILNNLLDNNAMRDAGDIYRWSAVVLLSTVMLLFFLRSGERLSAIIWFFLIFVISLVSYFMFSRYQLWMPPSIFYASFSFIFLLSYLVKLNRAAVDLARKQASVIKLLGADADGLEDIYRDTGILGLLSPRGINTRVNGLIRVEHKYEAILEDTVKKRTAELARALTMISNMSNEMILRLTKAAESRDEDTGAHIQRIGLYARAIAAEVGMSEEFVDMISFASAMHDIGKIGVPDRILLKHGKLDNDERLIMNSHTTIGGAILANSEFPKIRMSEKIALCHHEKWDGSGYPQGLKGEAIPIEARIVAVCDVYDALRSRRPYKMAFDHSTAVRIMRDGDERVGRNHLDPDLMSVFLRIEPMFDTLFELNQG